MKIYFVRHGESEANVRHVLSAEDDGFPLTEKGIHQAEALAASLRGIRFERIYTSPILRAVQTSEILARALNLSTELSPALREYGLGVLEGRSDEEAWRIHKETFVQWARPELRDTKPEGGESFNEIKDRFVPFIDRLVDEQGAEEVNHLAVSHGGVIMLMLPEVFSNFDFTSMLRHPLQNTAVVVGKFSKAERLCLQWGDQVLERD